MQSYWHMIDDDPQDDDALDADDDDTLGLGLLSWRPGRRYVLGLDLGQTKDYTALAVVQ
jgi:hypothetical protein